MKLIGVACVKNEADIIEAFVRHNLHYLDSLILMDHGSTDETAEILQSLQREGLPLEILKDDSLGKFQGDKMTLLMHRAAAAGADWVFLLDADELIKAPSFPLQVPDHSGSGVWKLGCQTYCVTAQDDPTELNPVLRIRHRLAEEPYEKKPLANRQLLTKCLVRRDVAGDPDSRVHQGNHHITIRGRELESAFWDRCLLAHYSLRSPGQYASKIAIGVMQHRARGDINSPVDSYYIKHLDLIRQDYEAFATDFHTLLPAYIETRHGSGEKVPDALEYKGGALKHTTTRSAATLFAANLINYVNTLALTLGAGIGASSDILPEEGHWTLHVGEDQEAQTANIRCQSGPLKPSQACFDLGNWDGRTALKLELSGPCSLVEVQKISLRRMDGSLQELQGRDLKELISQTDKLYSVPHDQYFSFIKSLVPSLLVLVPGDAGAQGRYKEMELEFSVDMNPAAIGLRFSQSSPMDSLELIKKLEAKVSQLVSVRGFLRHQAEWIWSVISPSKSSHP